MILEGNRIILRRFKEDDLNDFYNYAKDESIVLMLDGNLMNRLMNQRDFKQFLKSEEVIHHKSDNKVIGSIGLHQDDKRKHQCKNGWICFS